MTRLALVVDLLERVLERLAVFIDDYAELVALVFVLAGAAFVAWYVGAL